MSLFRLIEAYYYNVPNSSTFACGRLTEHERDQVIIGGEDGLITVIDPAGNNLSAEESFLAQHQTDQSVIQIVIGNFLQIAEPVVAVLHSHSLAYYILRYDDRDASNTSFQLVFTHDIGEPTFSMCVVDDDLPAQILVQTKCAKGDQCLLSRASLPALFPGPITYHHTNNALNIACGYHVHSIKFSVLSSLSNSSKKISVDWSFNCGDWPLQIFAIDYLPVPPSVLVVARRNVFCLPAMEPDRIKWQVRLETIAISAHVYKSDDGQEIRYLIATASNTMLVFKDNQLLWNCHMDFCPILFVRSSLNPATQHMIAMLSNDSRFVVGYMGTEPHLFKPTHESRVVDLKEMVEELKELERAIGGKPVRDITENLNKAFSFSVEVDHDRMEPVSRGEVPTIPLRVAMQGVPIGNSIETSISSCFLDTVRKTSSDFSSISLRVDKKLPWTSTVHLVAVCIPSHAKTRLPLNCIVAEATPDRNAELKVTIELDRHTIPINQLFPDRYRIQSDRMELLALITRELVARVWNEDRGIHMNSRPPLEYLQARVERQIEIEQSIKKLLAELERASLELRAIQALVISKTQNTKQEGMENVDFLYRKAHEELLTLIGRIGEQTRAKEELGNELCAIFDLIALVGEIDNQETLVDGHFYNNTQQSLIERISWATRKSDLIESLEMLCRHTSKALPQIAEEESEEIEHDPI